MPVSKDGGKGGRDGDDGTGGGGVGLNGGGAEGARGGQREVFGGENWGELFGDEQKNRGGVEGEDRPGNGGEYEADVDVAQRIAEWRDKKEREGCSDSFRPSKETMESDAYPSFDTNDLGRFAEKEKLLGDLAFKFFTFMMPMAIIALLVKEVRKDC